MWRFGRLDHQGKFGCHTLLSADVRELEDELKAFQDEPIWSLRERDWLKFVEIEDMTSDGRRRLTQISKQETGLWQLHLARHKWRVWGYFDEPEFFFLWWDSGHGVATGRSRTRRS